MVEERQSLQYRSSPDVARKRGRDVSHEIRSLPPEKIEATKATQVRTTLDKRVVDAYREELESGAIFPPLTVFAEKGSERYILADGFHRLYAAIHAGREEVDIELHEGGMHDALMFALGANAQHGLRRTNADKRRAVAMALKDPEISLRTQQEIADICRVTTRTVRRIQTDLLIKERAKDDINRTMSGAHKPTERDFRVSRPPPTQEEVDRDELRKAMSLIKAFPYSGDDTQKLKLSKDDVASVNYCIDWLTGVLEEHVRCRHQIIDSQDERSS